MLAKCSTGLATSAGRGRELVVDPGFEAGQVGVLVGEEPVMDEQARRCSAARPAVLRWLSRPSWVRGVCPVRDGGQERLDLGGAFPGDDAFRSIGFAEDVDEAALRFSGSAGLVSSRAVRSSRSAQRAQMPRR